jgi:hypothetical protein
VQTKNGSTDVQRNVIHSSTSDDNEKKSRNIQDKYKINDTGFSTNYTCQRLYARLSFAGNCNFGKLMREKCHGVVI